MNGCEVICKPNTLAGSRKARIGQASVLCAPQALEMGFIPTLNNRGGTVAKGKIGMNYAKGGHWAVEIIDVHYSHPAGSQGQSSTVK